MSVSHFNELRDQISRIEDKLDSIKSKNSNTKEWLTAGDVAVTYGISKRTIFNHLQSGVLQASKLGGVNMFYKPQIDEALINGLK